MQNVSLYEKVEEPDPFAGFALKEIFTDSEVSIVNGLKNQRCKTISFEKDNNIEGSDHMHLSWEQSTDCRYIGLGFAWGNYKSKDLSGIAELAALELMIRMDKGSASKIPVFFTLTDYGNTMCRAKINILDIEGGRIDTSWTRVRVPLQAFNYKKKGVNLSNIKDLRMELQRSGNIHIDAIKLVRHQHNYLPASENDNAVESLLPMVIGEGSANWWGVNPSISNNFNFNAMKFFNNVIFLF